ncbi:hypothetical protein KUTeg_020104 [Tegillarca granosa]|uniref:Sema domain-containing protein n=1 Tax=Tegillarca granosa TaxID=220873 RepID=A0ABQ9E734_TEGGR|nr:hypothetical protein KUTeg_020104 [Tegillarca granosa]
MEVNIRFVCLILLLLNVSLPLSIFALVHNLNEDNVKTLHLADGNSTLNHLVYDSNSNVAYIGAVNKIFKVDFDLRKLIERSTGPKNDSVECHNPEIYCDRPLVLTDNYNKILLIYRYMDQAKLIVCGSVYQGACETWSLPNLDNNRAYFKNVPSSVYAVAANSPDASTVAHISEGDHTNTRQVLYVATTFPYSPYELARNIRVHVPALSTRKLLHEDEMFDFQEISEPYNDISYKKLKEEVLQKGFIINYVTGFPSDGFSYFLTTQPKTVTDIQSETISKIVQICHNDTKYFSYVDVPLECGKYKILTTANIVKPSVILQKALNIPKESSQKVIVAAFSGENQHNTALCVYKMEDIRTEMYKTIQQCYKGNKTVNGGGYLKTSDCSPSSNMFSREQLLCNTQLRSYINIVGLTPVKAEPAIMFHNISITSIALTTTTDFTVGFLGTGHGHIEKVVIKSDRQIVHYERHKDIIVDHGSQIKQDMVFDRTSNYLFAISERKIARIKVENCNQYSTCFDCLSSLNPYCGWCTLENRCSVKSSCRHLDLEHNTNRWTNGKATNCIAISNVSPPEASVTEANKLYLTILDLPFGSNYSCIFIFNEFQQTVPASRWSYGLQCESPNITGRGINFGPSGHQVVSLAINSLETGKIFVTKNFTFYNCSSYTSCSKCVDNSWTCDWCIYDNKCTFDSIGCSPGIIYSKNDTFNETDRYTDKGKQGPLHCPRLDQGETGNLYIPNNREQIITVRGYNFPMLVENGKGYRCIIMKKNGGSITAKGDMINRGMILCRFRATDYGLSEGMYNASLRVEWGTDIPLENDGVTVSIYSCEILAGDDCSKCKSLSYTAAQLKCQWCDEQCKYSNSTTTFLHHR